MQALLYRNSPVSTSETTASRRKNHKLLCLLGCSRQQVVVRARKRRSSKGLGSPATINPGNTIPSGVGARLTGQNSTGHDGPDRKHEEGTSPVNHRH